MLSEDADGGCLQLPGPVWVGWLLAAGPWGTGTITEAEPTVGPRLSHENTVRPGGRRTLEADAPWLLMPPRSPNPGTTGSMAFSFLSTQ